MLRRRFITQIVKLVRIFGRVIATVFNKDKIDPAPIDSTLAKIDTTDAASTKTDSGKYDASIGELDVYIAAKPDLSAQYYDASLASFQTDVATTTNIDSEPADAVVTLHDESVFTNITTDAIAVELALDIARNDVTNNVCVGALSPTGAVVDANNTIKIYSASGALDADSMRVGMETVQQICSDAKPLSGQVKFVNLGVSTCDKPSMIAAAAEKTYAYTNVIDTVQTLVDPDMFSATDAVVSSHLSSETDVGPKSIASIQLDDNISAASASVSFVPEPISIVNISSNTKDSIMIAFAPIAKTIEWLDPILTDNSLLIRQAYEINQNNNTLEVV